MAPTKFFKMPAFTLMVLVVVANLVPGNVADDKLVGTPAKKGEFPYIIGFKNSNTARVSSGILVKPNMIITSASLVHETTNRIVVGAFAHAGAHMFSDFNYTANFEDVQVRKISKVDELHPCYPGVIKDISYNMVKVMVESPFDIVPGKVELAWLHTVNEPIDSKEKFSSEGVESIFVAGWGVVSEDPMKNPDELQKSELNIELEKDCDKLQAKEIAFCVRGTTLRICRGDVGNPVFVKLKNPSDKKKSFVAGLIHGGDCGAPVAAVFDLTKHVCWVADPDYTKEKYDPNCQPSERKKCSFDIDEGNPKPIPGPGPNPGPNPSTPDNSDNPSTGTILTNPKILILLAIVIFSAIFLK